MKQICILSKSAYSDSGLKIEGFGYTSKSEGKKYMQLFKERDTAVYGVNKKYNIPVHDKKVYWVQEINFESPELQNRYDIGESL